MNYNHGGRCQGYRRPSTHSSLLRSAVILIFHTKTLDTSAFHSSGYKNHSLATSRIFKNRSFPMHASGTGKVSADDDVPPSMAPTSPDAEAGLLQIIQSHFASQALLSFVRLGIPDILPDALDHVGDSEEGKSISSTALTVDDIITKLKEKNPTTINREVLYRSLRLLCTTGVLQETTKVLVGTGGNHHATNNKENGREVLHENASSEGEGIQNSKNHHQRSRVESAFALTETGKLLRTDVGTNNNHGSMAPFILHWMEEPLWNAWAQLPDYVSGNTQTPPFDSANDMSASEYYSTNSDSRTHRNAVARYASSREIPSILEALLPSKDESVHESNENGPRLMPSLKGKTIVDVGGGYGELMMELKAGCPDIGECFCLDLPNVISDAISTCNVESTGTNPTRGGVSLVAGDMFDPSTIPTPCDLIFTKHVLCDFDDDDCVKALRSFYSALSSSASKGRKVIIMDAVLPNGKDLNNKWNAAVSFDVLLMLTGRRGERSRVEWENLAKEAGFDFEGVVTTSSVTVDFAVLSIPDDV